MTTRHLFCAVLLAIAGAGATVSCTSGGMDTADVIDSAPQEAVQRAQVRLVCNVPTVTTAARAGAATRAALTANGKAMTDLYILDYDKTTGALLQVLHQTSEAADFAEPNLTLDYGEHVLKVLATRSTVPTLLDASDSTFNVDPNVLTRVSAFMPVALTAEKTSDTFGAQKEVTIGIGAANTIAITLDRLVARMVVKSTDTFPTDCSTWDLTWQEYKTLSWQSLDVTAVVNNHRSTDVSSLASTNGTTITYYVLAPKEGYTTDVTFTINRKAGTPYSTITVPNVTFERNKTTTITGSFYNHNQGFSISLNDAWEENGYDINI